MSSRVVSKLCCVVFCFTLYSIGLLECSNRVYCSTASSRDHALFALPGYNDSYIYIESSAPRRTGDKARLISPNMTGPHCATFYYNLNGAAMAFLSVFIKSQRGERMVWLKSKNRGDTWIKTQININETGTYQVSCIQEKVKKNINFIVFYL